MVCGGEATEPRYFHGLIRARKAPHVKVKVRPKGVGPSGLVEHAKRLLARGRDDVDQFTDIPQAAKAARPDIRLAVSNPCFELWLLLHFEETPPHCLDYAEAVRRLRRHLPQYDKRSLDYAAFAAGVDAALERSPAYESLNQTDTSRPFSGVGALVRRIIER